MATWKKILTEGDVTGTSPITVTGSDPVVSLDTSSLSANADDDNSDELLVYDQSAGTWTTMTLSQMTSGYVDTTGAPGVKMLAVFTDGDTITGYGDLSYDSSTNVLNVAGVVETSGVGFALQSPASLDDGVIAYDTDRETLVFQSEHGELAIGETYKPAYNNTGSTIAKGAAVKATGVSGEKFLIELFDASAGVDEELYFVGVTQQAINDQTAGIVVSEGLVKHLDTSTYSVGTLLYASETAGGLTSTKPTSPNLGVPVAMVTKVDGTNGHIYVRPSIYSHLEEIHDVLLASPADGEALIYNSSTGVWENGAVVSDLLGLDDTPSSYGSAGQVLAVNTTTDGTEWITVAGGTGYWTQTGNDIYYTTGNVGIGVGTPSEALDVLGQLKLSDTSSTNNIVIHSGTGPALTTGVQSIVIGDLAGRDLTTENNNVMIGYRAGEKVNSGFGHVFIGPYAGTDATSGPEPAMAIGLSAMRSATSTEYGTAIGREAGRFNSQYHGFSLGFQAGYNGAQFGVFVGSQAGHSARGQRHVAIGYQALYSNGNTGSVGNGTIALGYKSFYNARAFGAGMIAIGLEAGYSALTSSDCIFLGYRAGRSVTSGTNNILIGTDAGYGITTGSSNTFLGYNAGYTIASGGGNVFIGYGAGYSETGSNKLHITNSTTGVSLVYGEFDNDLLRINGKLEIGNVSITGFEFPTTTGTQGQILELDTDGSTLIWADPPSGPATTDNLTEGASNLYYDDTLVQTYLTAEKIRANYPTATFTGNTSITSSHEQSMMIGNSATGITFQVSAGLSRDCEILVMQYGAGDITITGATGVTIRTTSDFQAVTGGQYSIIGLKQIGTTDEYIVTGERKPV